jgi:hypothetical protein
VATPSDLIRDARTTPFNIGRRIELHDFTQAEARSLLPGLRRKEKQAAELLRRVLYWTAGHPYLTQRLCQAVAADQDVKGSREVDQLTGELFLSHRAWERDENLLFVRERLLRSEVDLADLLSLYERVHRKKKVRDDEANAVVGVLRLSGIARVEDGRLHVRNRIYGQAFDRQWIQETMPDAELLRQRAAYRKGLLRAGAIAALVLAAISILAILALEQRNRAVHEADRARAETKRADGNLHRAELSAAEALKAQGEAEERRQQEVLQRRVATEQRARAEREAEDNRRLLYVAQMSLARQAWDETNIPRMLELIDRQIPDAGQEDLRGFEWYLLWRLGHSSILDLSHSGQVSSVAFSPDGKKLATASPDGTNLWDVASGRKLNRLNFESGRVVFSANGRVMATASRHELEARLWDVATGRELMTFNGHAYGITSVAISPDSRKLATASFDRTARLWELSTGKELAVLKGHEMMLSCVAFSPDGTKVATGSQDSSVKLWDAASGEELKAWKSFGELSSLAFSPDGKTLATGSTNFSVRLWEVETGRQRRVLMAADGVLSVAFSADGNLLAAAPSIALADSGTVQRESCYM